MSAPDSTDMLQTDHDGLGGRDILRSHSRVYVRHFRTRNVRRIDFDLYRLGMVNTVDDSYRNHRVGCSCALELGLHSDGGGTCGDGGNELPSYEKRKKTS